MQTACFHCGLPVKSGHRYSANILGQSRDMCCAGCQAVAEAIIENGLAHYYEYRTELPKTANELIPEELKQLTLYDRPEVQKSFVLNANGSIKEALLMLEGITCAACIWLNERHLKQLSGIQSVTINYASQRARVSWNDEQIKLSHILAEIRKLGYSAHPYSAKQQETLRASQRKSDLRRLAVAALSAAQVMMMAVALYAGRAQGLELGSEQLLRLYSLVMTLPAVTYSAWPLYSAAFRSIKNAQLGMDVPISIGILTGFLGSVWAMLNAEPHVYFDTITMLIFFLLVSRFLEQNAKQKSIEAAENLLRFVPAMATKIDGESQNLVAVTDLQHGDHVLVKPGETIVADANVISGESSVDESLLTGESRPVSKKAHDKVLAGSVNYESPLVISITGLAEETQLAAIARLLDRAQHDKPRLTELTNQVATWFTYALLLIVCVVGLSWYFYDSSRVLSIVLSVLVVSCPCALSLASPLVFAAAGSHLVKRGVLVTRGHAIETLAKVTQFVFDKTGTLTLGKPTIVGILPYAATPSKDCLLIAASMEANSEHPIAKSFLDATKDQQLLRATDMSNTPGAGVTAKVAGRLYRLGNKRLVPEALDLEVKNSSVIWLADDFGLLAAFVIQDQIRVGAHALLDDLRLHGYKTSILSGDSNQAVLAFAQQVGILDYSAELTPQDKLNRLQALQAQGEVVAVVGDGINDAPVLAGAQLSIAMGGGADMARNSGDIILLGDQLVEIGHAVTMSRFAMRVMHQNFVWALLYNLVALPFAAFGLISPLIAAVGMSTSSLIVVINALRLR